MAQTNERAINAVIDRSLLGLALAITGKEVDMELVQLFEATAHRDVIMALRNQALLMGVAGDDEDAQQSALSYRGYAQDDGSLMIVMGGPRTGVTRISVAPRKWKLHTTMSMQQLLRVGVTADPKMLEAFQKNVRDCNVVLKQITANVDNVLSRINQMITIADRSDNGLMMIRHFAKAVEADAETMLNIDAWLSGTAPYLCLSQGAPKSWVLEVSDMRMALATLKKCAESAKDSSTIGLMLATGAANAGDTELKLAWRSTGGLVFGEPIA